MRGRDRRASGWCRFHRYSEIWSPAPLRPDPPRRRPWLLLPPAYAGRGRQTSARRPKDHRFENEAPHWRPRVLPRLTRSTTLKLHWAIFARFMVRKALTGWVCSVGMWSVVVVLPVVQAEFGATRGAVSLAFTLTMLGFGLGGVATGKITDRFGIVAAMALSISFLGFAYVLAGLSTTLWQFIAVHVLIGLGTSATFGPLMAEASHWFERYRGLAVTIVASGNYVGGTIWPPLVNWGVQSAGWRTTHIAIGIFCAAAMTIMLVLLRAQIGRATQRSHANAPPPRVDLRLSTNTVTAMLCIAS